jgi:L-ascorbate metabolism protein UlaG (beta-lactamase superfamily)
MKVTKYTHACVVLEDQGQKAIIDPGEFTTDFGSIDLSNVVAVVVTHNHADHFKPENLQAIISRNPYVVVFTTPEIVQQWGGPHAKAVAAYQDHQAGPFHFRFFGEEHAEIHASIPRPQNTGVLVNGSFYYPGDSFVLADRDVQVLALPVGAPWLKMGEAIDFFATTEPKICFPTHDAPLSAIGRGMADSWATKTAQDIQCDYKPLNPGDSFEY